MSELRRTFRHAVFVLLLLTPGATTSAFAQDEAEESGITPATLIELLHSSIATPKVAIGTTWQSMLDPTFRNWRIGSSHNLPVVAAAIALVRRDRDTTLPDTRSWWLTFLTCQNGGPCPVADPGALVYFKGSELFSSTYDWSVVTSVATVNWWARVHDNVPLRDAARLYLRKTWSLYSLAAGTEPLASYLDNTNASGSLVDGPATFSHPCTTQGPGFFDGPYLALAAARAGANYFCTDNKRILFTQAIEWPVNRPDPGWEQPPVQKLLRAKLVEVWGTPGGDGESVWALNAPEREMLRVQVSSAPYTQTLLDVINLGGTRFKTRYHFLGWNGVRATFIEHNIACPKCGGVIYAARFDSATRQARILYPWLGNQKKGHRQGTAQLLGPGPSGLPDRAWAENCSTAYGDECPPPFHGNHWGYVEFPATPPMFHIVLGPDGPGYFE